MILPHLIYISATKKVGTFYEESQSHFFSSFFVTARKGDNWILRIQPGGGVGNLKLIHPFFGRASHLFRRMCRTKNEENEVMIETMVFDTISPQPPWAVTDTRRVADRLAELKPDQTSEIGVRAVASRPAPLEGKPCRMATGL
jgi:hypothetical protein